MRSFITYPHDFERFFFTTDLASNSSGKSVSHFALYRKIRHLEGSIIKCGITAFEGYTRFAMFRSLMRPDSTQKMIAFEKDPKYYADEITDKDFLPLNYEENTISIRNTQQTLIQNGIKEEVSFIPGIVDQAIPNFLIENPELKIAFLNIDLDNYESALSALEYFYPRLIEGGILVIDNYYKFKEEYKAIQTYFYTSRVIINNFLFSNSPHYIIKN
jgi:hypothetical protein